MEEQIAELEKKMDRMVEDVRHNKDGISILADKVEEHEQAIDCCLTLIDLIQPLSEIWTSPQVDKFREQLEEKIQLLGSARREVTRDEVTRTLQFDEVPDERRSKKRRSKKRRSKKLRTRKRRSKTRKIRH